MKSMHNELGNRIRQYRLQSELSQEKLALNAGLTVSFIGDIERGIKKPSVESLEKLLDALGISFLEFFDYETEIKPLADCSALEKLTLYLRSRPNADVEMIFSIAKQILEHSDTQDINNTP